MLNSDPHRRSMFSIAGWLFADMLLAIMMIFIVASTTSVTILPKKQVTPTPKILPRLELTYHRFQIVVDPNGLLNDVPDAVSSVKKQVLSQPFLKGRSVGFIVVYGGAPDDSYISTAQSIANKVYSILLSLGKQVSEFSRASVYDPLFLLNGDLTHVTIDIFLFA